MFLLNNANDCYDFVRMYLLQCLLSSTKITRNIIMKKKYLKQQKQQAIHNFNCLLQHTQFEIDHYMPCIKCLCFSENDKEMNFEKGGPRPQLRPNNCDWLQSKRAKLHLEIGMLVLARFTTSVCPEMKCYEPDRLRCLEWLG